MESVTPPFHSKLGGMQRLEQQEREKQEEEARKVLSEGGADGEDQTMAKRRRACEHVARRARRLCIRLASMANRWLWLSTTEVALHILTGGDCFHSHHTVRFFTRQLQWACQYYKRLLNHEGAGEVQQSEQRPIQPVLLHILIAEDEEPHSAGRTGGAPQPAGETPAGDEQDVGAEGENMQACTTSTNTADDFVHTIYVRRVLKPSRVKPPG